MSIKITQTKNILTDFNSNEYRKRLLLNIKETLKEYDFKTKCNSESIEFNKTLRHTMNYGENMREGRKFLKHGKIEIILRSKSKIRIRSSYDITYLLIMSLFSGLLIFLFGLIYLNYNIEEIGIFTLKSILVIFIFVWVRIFLRINKIIRLAREKT